MIPIEFNQKDAIQFDKFNVVIIIGCPEYNLETGEHKSIKLIPSNWNYHSFYLPIWPKCSYRLNIWCKPT